MRTAEFLSGERTVIIREAETALARLHERHYESAGAPEVERRLESLFDHLVTAVDARDLTPVIGYAQEVADERFAAGYDLSEVQAAFNVLEAATWSRILDDLEPAQLAEALGLVSTVFGAAKDALGRRYVSLATKSHAPSLDLRALFAGTDGI
ncbi:MAG: hypothetical protein ACXWZP_00860 [Gaiellaceae bacterium]